MTTLARRLPRYTKASDHHICTRCILPGDQVEITGPGSVLLIATVREFVHPIVPADEEWLIAETATGRGIALEYHPFCPFDPMPGTALPCGCHMQMNGDAVLCTPHEAAALGDAS
jgi:hypothetical protein